MKDTVGRHSKSTFAQDSQVLTPPTLFVLVRFEHPHPPNQVHYISTLN